jgi:hypothetical protein
MDMIAEAIRWTGLARQWTDNGIGKYTKKIYFFLLSMKMVTAWDGIYRRKILRTGVMSEVRPLDAFGTAVPQ